MLRYCKLCDAPINVGYKKIGRPSSHYNYSSRSMVYSKDGVFVSSKWVCNSCFERILSKVKAQRIKK